MTLEFYIGSTFFDESLQARYSTFSVGSGKSPVVVDFWASWCAPCRAVSPSIEKLAAEFGDQIKFGKLDVDANPTTTAKYGISSIPTIAIFRNGEITESFVGVRPYERYQQAIIRLSPNQCN